MTGLTIKNYAKNSAAAEPGIDRIKIPRVVPSARRLVALCTIVGGGAISNLTDFWI
jgi:hypothetical protein